MENRLTLNELRLEMFMNFGYIFWLTAFALVVLISIGIMAIREYKKNKNLEKSERDYGEIASILGVGVFIILFWCIFYFVIIGSEIRNAATTTDNDFFNYQENVDWFTENQLSLYDSLKEKEYELFKINKVSRIDMEEFDIVEEFFLESETKDFAYRYNKKHITKKEEMIIENFHNKDEDLFYVSLMVLTEDKKVKAINAITTLAFDNNKPENKILLKNTGDIENDPGDDVFYGHIEVEKDVFR